MLANWGYLAELARNHPGHFCEVIVAMAEKSQGAD
jgi:hypothetical protein